MSTRSKRLSFIKRLQTISRAVERADSGADSEDVGYIIAHLAFEAALLVRTGRFTDEAAKARVERPLYAAEKAARELAFTQGVEREVSR